MSSNAKDNANATESSEIFKCSLAEVAAAMLLIEGKHKLFSGDLGLLGEIYGVYAELNDKQGIVRKGGRAPQPARNQAIRNACANTKDGKRLFEHTGWISYPGIANRPSRVFTLKDGIENDKRIGTVRCACEKKLDERYMSESTQ